MATGMSKAKARRNSKTKARASRAKLGLPAKAGKRRPHNIMHDKNGDYTAAPFVARPRDDSPEPKAYMMTHEVKLGDRIPVPTGHHRKEGLAKIASMKRGAVRVSGSTSTTAPRYISHDLGLVRYFCDRIVVRYLGAVKTVMSDPFVFDRMATHFVNGLVEV